MRKLRLMLAGTAFVAGAYIMAEVPWHMKNISENRSGEAGAVLEEEQASAYMLSIGETSVILSSLEEVTEVIHTIKELCGGEEQGCTEDGTSEASARMLAQASIEPENRPIVMAAQEEVSQDTNEIISFEDKIEIIEIQSAGTQVMSVEEAIDIVKSAFQAVSESQETYSDY